jgi:hypothetical protein
MWNNYIGGCVRFFGSLLWIFSLWCNNYQYFQKIKIKDVRSLFLQNDHLEQFFVTSFVHFEMACFWKYISYRVNFIAIDCLKYIYISLLQWCWTIIKKKIVISHIGDQIPRPLVDLLEHGPTICCMKFNYIEKDCWSPSTSLIVPNNSRDYWQRHWRMIFVFLTSLQWSCLIKFKPFFHFKTIE